RRLHPFLDRGADRRERGPAPRRPGRSGAARGRPAPARPRAALGDVARRPALPASLRRSAARRRGGGRAAPPRRRRATRLPAARLMNLYPLARPLLGLLDPETAHRLAVVALARGLGPRQTAPDDPILACRLWDRDFANPVGIAAG